MASIAEYRPRRNAQPSDCPGHRGVNVTIWLGDGVKAPKYLLVWPRLIYWKVNMTVPGESVRVDE